MKIRGIKKGDKDLRHFTFDDGDVMVRGGTYMYKVTYDKNPLEGEYAENEIGYVECDKVIPLGGRKPKPIVRDNDRQEEPNEVKEVISTVEKQQVKRGRKPKNEKVNTGSEVISPAVHLPDSPGVFEYFVTSVSANDVTELQNKLNEQGEKGWELCGFDTNKTLFGSIHIVAVFKRKRG